MVLALDPATRKTGFAIFDGKKLIHYGVLEEKDKDTLVRISKMAKKIGALIESYSIDEVVVEEVPPKRTSIQTLKSLYYLQHSIILILRKYNITPEFLEVSRWRSLCKIRNGRGVKREEEKQLDILFAKEQYGVEVTDDVADAIGIGHAYLNGVNVFER